MKTVLAGMTTKLTGASNNSLNFVACYMVQQKVSQAILGFTEHDQDIDFDLGDGNGVITYKAANSFIRKAVANTNTFAVDNLQIEGIIDPSGFPIADLEAGKFDRALIKKFYVDWTDLTLGEIKSRRGTIGETTIAEKSFEAEIRGMLQAYTDEIVEEASPGCRVDLGSTRCGERLDPPAWAALTAYTVVNARESNTGSVVKPIAAAGNDRHFRCSTAGTSGASEPSWNLTIGGTTSDGSVVWTTIQARTVPVVVDVVTDNRNFTVTYTGDAPDAFFTLGLATFTSGNNLTVRPMDIKDWILSTNTIELYLPMPLLVVNGDTLNLRAGCDKTMGICNGTFNNNFNFQAENHVPGGKVIFRTPNAQ